MRFGSHRKIASLCESIASVHRAIDSVQSTHVGAPDMLEALHALVEALRRELRGEED